MSSGARARYNRKHRHRLHQRTITIIATSHTSNPLPQLTLRRQITHPESGLTSPRVDRSRIAARALHSYPAHASTPLRSGLLQKHPQLCFHHHHIHRCRPHYRRPLHHQRADHGPSGRRPSCTGQRSVHPPPRHIAGSALLTRADLEHLILNDTPMTPAPALQPSDGFRDITKEFFELSESARSSSLLLGWLADGCGCGQNWRSASSCRNRILRCCRQWVLWRYDLGERGGRRADGKTDNGSENGQWSARAGVRIVRCAEGEKPGGDCWHHG